MIWTRHIPRPRVIRENPQLSKTVLLMAAPAVADMLLRTLISFVDVVMIGQFLGKEALSASGYANLLMYTSMFTVIGFNYGAAAIIARYYGGGKLVKLRRVISENFSLNIFASILLVLVLLPIISVLVMLYRFEPVVESLYLSYVYIVLLSIPAFFILFSGAITLRALGNTKLPMQIAVVAIAFNIVGNYVLITGFWFFPELGVKGAAIATVLARYLEASAYLYIFFVHKGVTRIKVRLMRPTRGISGQVLRLGVPTIAEEFMVNLSINVLLVMLAIHLETASEAALPMLLNIESLSFMPGVGLAIASAALCGQSLGAGDSQRAVLVGRIASVYAITWGLLMTVLFLFAGSYILLVYTSDAEVLAAARIPVLIFAINQPLLIYVILMTGFIRGSGATKVVMLTTTLRQWVFVLPVTGIVASTFDLGLEAFYIGEFFGFGVFAVILYVYFRRGSWLRVKIR